MDLEKIAIEKIIEMIKNKIPTIPEVIRSKPYGVVHDSVFVNIDGQKRQNSLGLYNLERIDI